MFRVRESSTQTFRTAEIQISSTRTILSPDLLFPEFMTQVAPENPGPMAAVPPAEVPPAPTGFDASDELLLEWVRQKVATLSRSSAVPRKTASRTRPVRRCILRVNTAHYALPSTRKFI